MPSPNSSYGLVRSYINFTSSVNQSSLPDVSSLEGYLVAQFALAALSNIRVGQLSPAALLDSVYHDVLLNVGGLSLGPFLDTVCVGDASQPLGCDCNRGLRQVWLTAPTASGVTPFVYVSNGGSGASTPGEKDVFSFSGCGVSFQQFRMSSSGSVSVLVYVLPVVGVLVIATLIGLWRLTKNYRELRKLYSNEVCVLLTLRDIL